MLQNPNFLGVYPEPGWESLQHCLRPLTYGEGLAAPLPPPRTSPALGLSGLVSMGLRAQPITELATVLMTDFKYRPI